MELSGTITFTSKTSTAKIVLNGFTAIGDEGVYWVFDLSNVTRTGATPSNDEEFYTNFAVGGAAGSSGSSGTSGSSGSSGTSGSSGSSGSSGTSGSSGSSGSSGTSGLINLTTPDTNRLITVDNSEGTSGTAQPNLTFDASTDVLTVGEYLETTSDRIEVANGASGDIQSSISGTTYGGVIVDYIAFSTSREKQRTGTVRVTANSTGAVLAESSTTDIGNTDGIVFSVTASAGNFSLSVANTTGETIRVVFHNTRLKV